MRCIVVWCSVVQSLLLFQNTATTEIYTYGHTLSRHDALPLCRRIPSRAASGNPSGSPRARRSSPACRAARCGADRHSPNNRRGSAPPRSEEHTSELQSLMRTSYAVFCLKNTTSKHATAANNNTLSHVIIQANNENPLLI